MVGKRPGPARVQEESPRGRRATPPFVARREHRLMTSLKPCPRGIDVGSRRVFKDPVEASCHPL